MIAGSRPSGESQYGLHTASASGTLQRQARLSHRFESSFMPDPFPKDGRPNAGRLRCGDHGAIFAIDAMAFGSITVTVFDP
jgi:hypothetical protein